MHTLFVALAIVVNTVLVAWTVRRLMGGPVGWPRILVFSFIVALIANPLLLTTLEHAGIDEPAASEHIAVTAALSVLFIGWVIAFEISVLLAAEILVPTGPAGSCRVRTRAPWLVQSCPAIRSDLPHRHTSGTDRLSGPVDVSLGPTTSARHRRSATNRTHRGRGDLRQTGPDALDAP